MIEKITKLLKRKEDHFANSKQVTELAFTVGGIDYYQHVDELNIPYGRALNALTIYKEMDMKCDRFYLDQHIKAMSEIFAGKKIGFEEMSKMKQLNDQLKERVQWIIIPDHVYKLASIRYFDKNENPNSYDWKYAMKKIEHWKKHESANAFFLREPILRLVPFLRSAKVDLKEYSEAVEAMTIVHLEHISLMLPLEQRKALPGYLERLFWEEMQPTKSPASI
jgi:hypothetical protein